MYRSFCGWFAATALLALPVQAVTINATAATLTKAFAAAKAGDTIKLSGSFGATALSNRTFATTVTLDARAATFTGTLAITHVGNLSILGGQFGDSSTLLLQAVRVNQSDKITFSKPVVVGNASSGHGIDFIGSSHVVVDGGSFAGLRAGVTFSGVNGGIITRSTSVRAASDGFDIADSHQIKITHNSCSGTEMTAGAHPDCVQLWSIAGRPRQSDIEISDNTATGPTQGFSSFDPEAGGGLRIEMLRNRVDTSWSEGIACYNCDYSVFQDNVVTTQPGALFQTRIHIVGGSHNIISGNSVGAYAGPAAPAQLLALDDAPVGNFEPAIEVDKFADFFPDYDPSVAAVPEPGTWALLIAGFAAVGGMLRRRRPAHG